MSDELYETSTPGDGYEPSISFADLLDIVEHTDFSKTLKLPLRTPRVQPLPPRRFHTRALCRWLAKQRHAGASTCKPPSRRRSASASPADSESGVGRLPASWLPRRRTMSLDECGIRVCCSEKQRTASARSSGGAGASSQTALAASDEQDNYEYVCDAGAGGAHLLKRAHTSSEGEYLELEPFASTGHQLLSYADASDSDESASSEYESVNST